MVKVIGVGDCMVDKNLTNGMMYPGGRALNIAVNTKAVRRTARVYRCVWR